MKQGIQMLNHLPMNYNKFHTATYIVYVYAYIPLQNLALNHSNSMSSNAE